MYKKNRRWALGIFRHEIYSLILNFQHDADTENILYLQRYTTIFIILYCTVYQTGIASHVLDSQEKVMMTWLP